VAAHAPAARPAHLPGRALRGALPVMSSTADCSPGPRPRIVRG
jgi:hypothetical protein